MTRFGRFASVGLLGWVLQLVALSTLIAIGAHYTVATALAVELTILHNFAWHELYTWRDGRATSAFEVASRLLRFNASTALVSVLGNVVVTAVAIECLRVPAVIANTLAVSVLSILNYFAANRCVFAGTRPLP